MVTLLCAHSFFSPLWGVRSPAEMTAAARALGYSRVGLTERDGLYGLFVFLEAAVAEGLRPLIGAVVSSPGERAILWVRDSYGFGNLCRVLSERHCNPRFSLSAYLPSHRRGLVVASDCQPLVWQLAQTDRRDLFVELSPGHGVHETLKFARARAIPPVATCRAVGLSRSDFGLHRVLRAVALNTSLSRVPAEDSAREWDYLLSPQALADHFPHCPDAVENIEVISGLCPFEGPDSSTVLPVFGGLSNAESLELLRRRAYEGVARRYGSVSPAARERLEYELGIIGPKGFASYFLVVEEIVSRSPRTCGRGSAAASLVSYALGITHVDPLKYNLFFDRFLNPGRVDPPDIDVDFPWDERDGLLDAVFALYGSRRVAMVANQVGFKPRAALREVAKVYGMPEGEIARVQKLMSGKRRFGSVPGGEGGFEEPWPEIMEVAAKLGNHLRHLSVHCGGVVIAPNDIRDHAVIEVAAKGVPIIQWEKEQCEASGLVKIDLLGNRSLAVIRDVLEVVNPTLAKPLDFSTWRPGEDPATLETVRRGETMGCFYVESPATRQLLRKMWGNGACRDKEVFEHLVMASSIIRPAANRFIQEFIARMRGARWTLPHPLLEGALTETYGIAIYQEQVTLMSMALAGFTSTEGDWLRKILSKKDPSRTLADLADRFFRGAALKGVSPDAAGEAWSQILSFSGYSFCKPHSASYALVSLKCAYLKTHFPAAFLAAVLANHGGFYSPFAYVSEARRLGLTIQPPSVNSSDTVWRGLGSELRVGLSELKGVGAACAPRIVEERRNAGPYGNIGDFLRRVDPCHEDARLLARSGALDCLDSAQNRAALLWEVDSLFGNRSRAGKLPLLADMEQRAETPFSPAPHTLGALRRMEWEALGFPVSFHPLSPFSPAISRLKAAKGPPLIPARDLPRHGGRRVRLVGWRITQKPVRTNAGEPMEFVSFEDTTAIFETVLFPEAYRRLWAELSGLRPFLIEGVAQLEFGVPTVTVENLSRL